MDDGHVKRYKGICMSNGEKWNIFVYHIYHPPYKKQRGKKK